MADLLARGYITLAVVNDGYSLSLTTSSVSIPANHDGSDPDLSCAYTNISLSKGNVSQPIEVINVIPSTDGIQYTYIAAGPYSWKVAIIGLASNITSGYLDIVVRTPDEYQTSAKFNFSVVRNTAGVDWIEEWDGTYNQIGSNYVITPKLFAGHKTSEGKITGIYLGKLKGFIGEIFPFTLSDAEEGLYGYRDNKIVFYIDNNGARIGGWDITPNAIQCLDGTLTIKSEGAISSQHDGVTHWSLNKDGSASFANGKVTMDAQGNASFDGHIVAKSGLLAGWTIGENSIHKVGLAVNSARRFIAAANVVTSELKGDQFDWVKQYGGAAMYYTSNADYGFIGYKGDQLTFSSGSKNYIAGWNFDESAIWIGAKNNNVGQFSKDSSSITMGTNGIRGYKFYLDKNGAGALAGGNITWDETGKVTFSKDVELQWSTGIDNATDLASKASAAAKEAQEVAKTAGDKYGQLIGTYLTHIDKNGIYTGTVAADNIISGTISTANIKQVNNRWFLNQDGSGSLANGNISWDQAGKVKFSEDVILAWKDVLKVDNYIVSMTAPSVVCVTDNDGNNADLSNAYTTISVCSGKSPVKFTVTNVFPNMDGIQYSYENTGDYSWKVALTGVASSVQSGFLTIVIKTQDNFEMSVRFSFAMVRNPKELAFLEEWEGSYTQIGSNYVVTPRIFAGMKSYNGKLTGVYLGKLTGYLGQTLPFTLSEAEAGIYGYKDSTIIFSIDNRGALIAGWKFDSESLYLGDKNNVSGEFTKQPGSITIGTEGIRGYKWRLNSDGSGSLAGGKIAWDDAGNIGFAPSVSLSWSNISDAIGNKLTKIDANGIYTGTLTASQVNALTCTFNKGTIGGWDIGTNSISKNTVSLGSDGSIVNGVKWKLNSDGSGSLAGGKVAWDTDGLVEIVGKFTAEDTSAQTRIVIDPNSSGIKLYQIGNPTPVASLSFEVDVDRVARPVLVMNTLTRNRTHYETKIHPTIINMSISGGNGSRRVQLDANRLYFTSNDVDEQGHSTNHRFREFSIDKP